MPHPMRVARVWRASPNAWHLELTSDAPITFEPGQAMMLGRHGQLLRKPYSIASSPEEAAATGRLAFLLGTEDDDDIGPHLRDAAPGMAVDAQGPLGSLVLPARLDAGHVLFVAGGTGIAPLRSMWRALAVRAPGVGVTFHYSARTAAHFVYLDELREAASQSGGRLMVMTSTTRESGEPAAPGVARTKGVTPPADLLGRLDRARLASGLDVAHTRAFTCGPPAFVDHVRRTLEALGVARSRIHAEQW